MATEDSERTDARIASGLNILAGAWLVLAPFALTYDTQRAMWNSVIVGVVVAVLAAIRFFDPLRPRRISWAVFWLGFSLVVSPLILGLHDRMALTWHTAVLGVIVMALGAWSALSDPAST